MDINNLTVILDFQSSNGIMRLYKLKSKDEYYIASFEQQLRAFDKTRALGIIAVQRPDG